MEISFNQPDWKTPNTYDFNFSSVPLNSGVYVLTHTYTDFKNKKMIYEVLYVGSSNSLLNRYRSHEVIRKLNKKYSYIQFYFKEVDNYLEIEKKLIKKLQPKYNKIWL